ncbi:MAG: AAA family ATPase, partial [bacterium]|nr:AAA family ATPase [bacterium]
PEELKNRLLIQASRLFHLARHGAYSAEYDQLAKYLDIVTALPWGRKTEDVLNLKAARAILDKNHFGLDEVKERILEYLAVLSLNRSETTSRAPILCLIGLVGTGKTTLAFSIAEALGRKFIRLPFGGLADASMLRGQARINPDAEPGQIIKALCRAGSKNPVILLDEIDRVAEESRAEIMGVLIELLDPEQNNTFTDHFVDYPFDLSDVLFIATGNNTTNISPAVLDRLEPMQMPSYTDEEKITIGRDYVLPKVMKESGLSPENLKIVDEVWPKIVRPLGFDAGIRTLERTIGGICRKVAMAVVEGRQTRFVISEENSKDFLPQW